MTHAPFRVYANPVTLAVDAEGAGFGALKPERVGNKQDHLRMGTGFPGGDPLAAGADREGGDLVRVFLHEALNAIACRKFDGHERERNHRYFVIGQDKVAKLLRRIRGTSL